MILVKHTTFTQVLRHLERANFLSCDTETSGLYPYKKDSLFSIQISDDTEDYYFNFQQYPTGEEVLDRGLIKELQPLFDNKTVFMQKAKFDMAFLYKEGIRFDTCDVTDTEVTGRLIRNDHQKYSLDEQSKRDLGEEKDDRVMEYLKKHKLFDSITIPGKETTFKAFHFEEVPFDVIAPYGCKDTNLTRKLGMLHLQKIIEMSAEERLKGYKSVVDVHEMEKRLIHTCFKMERIGVKIDLEYCNEAIKFETSRIIAAKTKFAELTGGAEFTDSGQCLGPIFEGLGYVPGKTDTGEHEITDAFLESVDHPLGEVIQTYRNASKRANTYFKSYVYFADASGVIHADMRQAGTKTGRFSYGDPNLQNIPGDDPDNETDDSNFPIRRAFVPRPGYFFLSIDYKQMEFRMMLDEAHQHDLINEINNGLDPHDATAKLTGLTRKAAKTLNFGLLYGMGISKLATAIMKLTTVQKQALRIYDVHQKASTLSSLDDKVRAICTPILDEMKAFKKKYFAGLPMVENFIVTCSGAVKSRDAQSPGNGWLKTWYGRRSYFNDRAFAYKAANAKIQGGCADVVKLAMNKLDDFLKDKNSRMVIQVHDELLFEMTFDEMNLIDGIMHILETAYPSRNLPLTCSMSYSLKSFYDMIDGDPREHFGKETRNDIQGANSSTP